MESSPGNDTVLQTCCAILNSANTPESKRISEKHIFPLVKNLPAVRKAWVQSLGWEDPLEKERLPIPVFWPREFTVHGVTERDN